MRQNREGVLIRQEYLNRVSCATRMKQYSFEGPVN